MKIIKLWVVPIIIAVLIVLALRIFLFTFYMVQSDSMENTVHKHDIVLIQKRGKIKRNSIVLLHFDNYKFLSRCVALPNDTILIRNSKIFLNGKIFKFTKHPKTKIKKAYILKTDSFIQNLFLDKNIRFNRQLSYFGVYEFNTDENTLKELFNNSFRLLLNSPQLPAGLYDDRISAFVNRFYWNQDNTGLIIVPAKGNKIELSSYNYELYKQIIHKESSEKYHRIGQTIYLNHKVVKNYTFKYNYYFVINDNRSFASGSRNIGFIREDEIEGKLLMRF